MINSKIREKLPSCVKRSLFISAYFPLFLIIIMRQIEQNINYLNFGGINYPAIKVLMSKFGISIILGIISVWGLMGFCLFMKNTKELTKNNGNELLVGDIKNKNAESIGYVATYILPFVFQTYSSLFDILQLALLLFIIYTIYVHSTLIIVNPLLNLMGYSLYEVEYNDQKSPDVKRNSVFIVNSHYLEKGDILLAKKVKTNLFYGIIPEDEK